jgi:hypothetical protein
LLFAIVGDVEAPEDVETLAVVEEAETLAVVGEAETLAVVGEVVAVVEEVEALAVARERFVSEKGEKRGKWRSACQAQAAPCASCLLHRSPLRGQRTQASTHETKKDHILELASDVVATGATVVDDCPTTTDSSSSNTRPIV